MSQRGRPAGPNGPPCKYTGHPKNKQRHDEAFWCNVLLPLDESSWNGTNLVHGTEATDKLAASLAPSTSNHREPPYYWQFTEHNEGCRGIVLRSGQRVGWQIHISRALVDARVRLLRETKRMTPRSAK